MPYIVLNMMIIVDANSSPLSGILTVEVKKL